MLYRLTTACPCPLTHMALVGVKVRQAVRCHPYSPSKYGKLWGR